MSFAVAGIEEVCEAVASCPPGQRLLPVAGATKPPLARAAGDTVPLDVSGLRGITAYDPAELTLSARAGTPVAEIAAELAEHGQYLPFNPPLALAGATLAGALAAGASGPGALRYGGVREFVIGVRFVDGTARLVAGGGRVVKNAAGFDFPKLMVGSIGRLGVLVEVSVKVFPRAQRTVTLAREHGCAEDAIATVAALARAPIDLEALDVSPDHTVLARLGGDREALAARAGRLQARLGGPVRRIEGEQESALWGEATELRWVPGGSCVVRVPLGLHAAAPIATWAAREQALVRFSLAAKVAWLACEERRLGSLSGCLTALDLTGVVLAGDSGPPLIGRADRGGAFGARVRAALDPFDRFAEL